MRSTPFMYFGTPYWRVDRLLHRFAVPEATLAQRETELTAFGFPPITDGKRRPRFDGDGGWYRHPDQRYNDDLVLHAEK